MKNLVLTVLAALALSGCAVDKPTYGPDGHAAHSINCSGSALTWNACYEKAGDLCGSKGYTVIERNESSSVAGGSDAGSSFFGPVISRTLLIECKRPTS